MSWGRFHEHRICARFNASALLACTSCCSVVHFNIVTCVNRCIANTVNDNDILICKVTLRGWRVAVGYSSWWLFHFAHLLIVFVMCVILQVQLHLYWGLRCRALRDVIVMVLRLIKIILVLALLIWETLHSHVIAILNLFTTNLSTGIIIIIVVVVVVIIICTALSCTWQRCNLFCQLATCFVYFLIDTWYCWCGCFTCCQLKANAIGVCANKRRSCSWTNGRGRDTMPRDTFYQNTSSSFTTRQDRRGTCRCYRRGHIAVGQERMYTLCRR